MKASETQIDARPLLDLDDVAGRLNAIVERNLLETAAALGSAVLDLLFEGEPTCWADRRHPGHRRLRELGARVDLLPSYLTLWRCASVEAQSRLMVGGCASLPFSHQVELLPVKDLAVKHELTHRTIAERWSRNELREAVRERQAPSGGRGRRRSPTLARAVTELRRAVGHVQDDSRPPANGDSIPDLLSESRTLLHHLRVTTEEARRRLEQGDVD